jgi:hypothetical protein
MEFEELKIKELISKENYSVIFVSIVFYLFYIYYNIFNLFLIRRSSLQSTLSD